MIFRKFAILSTAVALAICVANPARAFVMNYGNLNGTTVMYLQVTESNTDTVAYFGSPDITGDTLDFDPVNFKVQSSGAQGSQIKDGQLNFTVMSQANAAGITQMVIKEAGDFTISAIANQIGIASAATTVNFSVTHVNGAALPAPCSATGVRMPVTPLGTGVNNVPFGGSYTSPGDVGTAVPWSGTLNFDVAALLASCGVAGVATKVEVALDNTLTANSANGGSAFIAKKDFNGVSITVPEPTLVGSILSILAGSAMLIRRRSA